MPWSNGGSVKQLMLASVFWMANWKFSAESRRRSFHTLSNFDSEPAGAMASSNVWQQGLCD